MPKKSKAVRKATSKKVITSGEPDRILDDETNHEEGHVVRRKPGRKASDRSLKKKRPSKKTKRGRGRPPKAPEDRADANRAKDSISHSLYKEDPSQRSPSGRSRCNRIIRGKNGEPDRQCKGWAVDGSNYCTSHGGKGVSANYESIIEAGSTHIEAHGLRRFVKGRFAELFDRITAELGDDDLSQELAAVRSMLSTQLDELSRHYDEYLEESQGMYPAERLQYWRTYNNMIKTTRNTIEQVRKIVGTVADVKAKQSGNTLTMIQVTLIMGDFIRRITDLLGEDVGKLKQLQSIIDQIDWLPRE